MQLFYILRNLRYFVSLQHNELKLLTFALCGLAIMAILITPAYADPSVERTSAGTLNVSFTTDPAVPNTSDPTQLKINFLNKQNSTQQHIDYKVSVMQGSNQVFGIPITHTAEGTGSIPFQFQTAGTYQVTIQVVGILFQPIPPETAVFTVNVGGNANSTPAVPEFGPLAGMIVAISIVSVIIITKRSLFHF